MGTPSNGWTLDTLKAHLESVIAANDRRYEQRFKDSQTAVDAALNAAKEAVLKAETASEKRFEGVNEFRQTLADQQRTLMPRSEAELRMSTMEAQLAAQIRLNTARGAEQKGGREVWSWVITGVMALVAVGSLFAAFARKP